MSDKKLVGVDADVDFKDGKAVIKLKHVGAHAEVDLEVRADALPIIDKVLDPVLKKLDDLFPGDQSELLAKVKKAAIEALT